MNFEQFQRWYVEPIRQLQENPSAGFPILLITLPLLERYVRNLCDWRKVSFGKPCCSKLAIIIPELQDEDIAGKFWTVFRHGLLHQVTMNQKHDGDTVYSELTRDEPSLVYHESHSAFSLNPLWFSNKVIMLIEKDFDTFVGGSVSEKPLPAEMKSLCFDSSSADIPYFQNFRKIMIVSLDEPEDSEHV